MKATDYLLMNETGAELIIEGGIFTATSATDANGVAVYNQENALSIPESLMLPDLH